MRWPWSKRAPPPRIPPYPVPVQQQHKPKEEGIVVEEAIELDGQKVDTRAMTETGIHKAWKRLTGQRE
jgi:hypothetical protein